MSEPREHWASDPNRYKSGVYTSKKCMPNQILFIEKSAYDELRDKLDKAVECLKRIEKATREGIPSPEAFIAHETLTRWGELKGGE